MYMSFGNRSFGKKIRVMLKFAFQVYKRKFAKPLVTAHGEWSDRKGILIAVTDANGILQLGEIAPLPWFGSETLEEAIEFCQSLGSEFNENLVIPNHLPCCQFAFESARSPLAPLAKGGIRKDLGSKIPLGKGDLGGSIAGLLAAGSTALEEWQDLYITGTRSFKWKIGVDEIELELKTFQQLCDLIPNDAKLRLDANAGLTLPQAKQWLEQCDRNPKIEYLEQPLGIHEFDTMLQLSRDYKTPIALDESIATYSHLEDCYHQGWRGIFVIKPAIAGAPSQLRKFCKKHNLDLVFSSVFETPIGRDAGLKLAQELGTRRALGYGTDRFSDQTFGKAIGILEKDAGTFLVQFWQAIVENRPVFFGNPDWGRSDLDRFEQIVETYDESLVNGFDLNQTKPTTRICIPTGGTSGKLKFAVHTWETLSASVYGMQEHFKLGQISSWRTAPQPPILGEPEIIMSPQNWRLGGLFQNCELGGQINSFCTLPLHHVSGFMQYFRSHLTQGQFIVWDWKQLEKGEFPEIAIDSFFLSLVPTQFQRLINQPKLREFKTILLGGAPAWESLLTIAREKQLPIALTYGMTELASQIATLLPQEFLSGNNSSGKPLPHIQIPPSRKGSASRAPLPESPSPNPKPLQIQSKSQMLTYYPIPLKAQNSDFFLTDDLGYLDPDGYLHIIGRTSDKIITGGENVYPSEIEALIRATGLVQDICVLGLPDETWGQRVVAACVAKGYVAKEVVPKELWQGSPQQYPKQWIALPELPRNAQGKLDRLQLLQLIQIHLAKI